MKGFGFFMLGLAGSLVAHTLFGSLSFQGVAVFYALAIYLLFSMGSLGLATAFLAGLTVGQELFGLSHLGLASAFGLLIALLHRLFGLRLRFTSRYIRFLATLLISQALYAVLLFPPLPLEALESRLLRLAVLYPLCALVTYVLFSTTEKRETTYELI